MPKFILLPGAWLGSWAWLPTAALMWREGHPAYGVTLTGMGERVHLLGPDVSMETAIRDVLNFAKYNEIDEYVLVGHSFAGKVAAAVADRAPDQVRKVIYLDAFRPERTAEPQGGFDPTQEFGPPPAGSWDLSHRGDRRSYWEGCPRGGPQPTDDPGHPLAYPAGQGFHPAVEEL